MDAELKTFTIRSAKHLSPSSYLNSSDGSLDDSEGDEDDAESLLSCPFCLTDIELHALCNHFEEEHFFDVKIGACPLCTLDLGVDPTRHFSIHHKGFMKHRRKSNTQETGGSMMLGNELGAFLGYPIQKNSVSDPFPHNLPSPNDTQQDKSSESKASATSEPERSKPHQSMLEEDDINEGRLRAKFVQDLVISSFL